MDALGGTRASDAWPGTSPALPDAGAPVESLGAVIDRLAARIAVLDADGTIRTVNTAWAAFAAEVGDPAGVTTGAGVNYLDACLEGDVPYSSLAARASAGIREVLERRRPIFALEYPCPSPRTDQWFVMIATPLGEAGAVVTHVDVTADHKPMDDPLRVVPSRSLVEGYVEAAMASAHPNEVAVLSVDVDGFREVNDTLGHHVGDRLLTAMAERLHGTAPAGTAVCRYEADDFVAIVPGIPRAQAAELAARIGEAMSVPFDLGADTVMVTVSIGVACYPADAGTARELVRCADAAVGEGKRSGRNTWRFFDAQVAARRRRRLSIGRELGSAIIGRQFRLEYQPQVRLSDGAVVGVEALLRWDRPDLGNPRPSEFIPVAESTGRIIGIGWWALTEAIAQMAAWRDAGLGRVALGVNVSSRHFAQPAFSQRLLGLLTGFGWPADLLELEITEHQAMRQRGVSIRVMEELRGHGVGFALDDFGSGYSSVANLRAFPLRSAKIDPSFVAAIGQDARGEALVAAMVRMIRSLDLTCVAEGVQEDDQAEFLAECGCDVVQGFRYSPALPPDALAEWVRARG